MCFNWEWEPNTGTGVWRGGGNLTVLKLCLDKVLSNLTRLLLLRAGDRTGGLRCLSDSVDVPFCHYLVSNA